MSHSASSIRDFFLFLMPILTEWFAPCRAQAVSILRQFTDRISPNLSDKLTIQKNVSHAKHKRYFSYKITTLRLGEQAVFLESGSKLWAVEANNHFITDSCCWDTLKLPVNCL